VAAKTGKKKKKVLQQPTGTRGARCANNCWQNHNYEKWRVRVIGLLDQYACNKIYSRKLF
jgi:hypothetical protein